MADKTAEQYSVQAIFPSRLRYPVKASKNIYAGCMVMLIDGYAYQADDAAKGVFVGVATETIAGGSSDGDVDVEVLVPGPAMPAIEVNTPSTVTYASWLGQFVYIVDSVTVALVGTTSKDVPLGVVIACTKLTSTGKVVVDVMRRWAGTESAQS